MFIAVYSELPKLEKKKKRYPLASEWLRKRHYFHKMKCYCANKRNELKSNTKQNYIDSREINGFWGFVREWLENANKRGLLRSVRFSL